MNALRLVFLLIAASVVGLLAWHTRGVRLTVPPARVQQVPQPVLALEQAMRAPVSPVPSLAWPNPPTVRPIPSSEDRLAEVPEFTGFYAKLKSDFPHDYDAVLVGARGADGPAGADAAIWDALRDLQQSKGILAAHAGAAALDRFFDARSAMLEGLAPLNARQCVDFLYGLTDASIADFTASHRGLVATLADRTIDAIADGRTMPPERSAPTAADLDALSTALAAQGLSPLEIGVLIDGTTPERPITDARLCQIGRTYLDALRGLPADVRQRIYGLAAELLARS